MAVEQGEQGFDGSCDYEDCPFVTKGHPDEESALARLDEHYEEHNSVLEQAGD